MDLFVYEQTPGPSNAVILSNGQMINGLDSVMWIERYLPAGEFTLVGKVSKGFREQLPVGSLISHTGTTELMVVESHEINDDGGSESTIQITGRSFETYLENRTISSFGIYPFYVYPSDLAIQPYYGGSNDPAWEDARYLISKHMRNTYPTSAGSAIDNIQVTSTVSGIPIVGANRAFKVGDGNLYTTVLDLLLLDNCGIKSVRPGPWNDAYAEPGPTGPFYRPIDFGFVIHNGVDRRQEVSFSWSEGDVKSGQYLWTNKNKKTAVLVQSKWYRQYVTDGSVGLAQRIGFVDGTDLDQKFSVAPTGSDRTKVDNAMIARGQQYLAAQKDINISRIELTENNSRYSYRNDYNVGDIVGVNGNYNTEAVMRVAEFVEIQDTTGYSGYPTLEAI